MYWVTKVAHESAYSGLYRQVVLTQVYWVTDLAHGLVFSGLCRQVVLTQRCIGITEVAHGSACSGLCGQVVYFVTISQHTYVSMHVVHHLSMQIYTFFACVVTVYMCSGRLHV